MNFASFNQWTGHCCAWLIYTELFFHDDQVCDWCRCPMHPPLQLYSILYFTSAVLLEEIIDIALFDHGVAWFVFSTK